MKIYQKDNMTNEQIKTSAINQKKAWDYFVSIGSIPEDSPKYLYVLHHINPSWKHEDIERYIQWNIEDLIPMTRAKHNIIHNKGKLCAEETKRKISKGNTGKIRSEEEKKQISEKLKGRPSPNKGKKHPGMLRGMHWYNNGITEIRAKECPEGFISGRLKRC